MQLARNFFQGCTVLAFLHSHFDRRLARCSAKKVLELQEDVISGEVFEVGWSESMVKLDTFLEIMGSSS